MNSDNKNSATGQYTHGPDFRRFFRLLSVNSLSLLSAALFSISVAILVDIFETPTYLSETIVSVSDHTKANTVASISGITTIDNFTPKISNLIEQFRGKAVCSSLTHDITQIKTQYVLGKVGRICSAITIEPNLEKLSLRVLAKTEDPVFSKLAADLASKKLIELDQRRLSKKVSELKQFLSTQEKDLGEQLKSLEDEKTRFQSSTSILSVSQAEKNVYENLEKSQQDYFDLEIKIQTNEGLIKQTRKTLDEVKLHLTQADANPSGLYLNQIQYRLNMLKYRKSMTKDGPTSNAALQLDHEINEIINVYKTALDGKNAQPLDLISEPLDYYKSLQTSLKALEKDHSQLQFQMSSLDGNIKKKGDEIKILASNIQKLGNLDRSIEVTNNLYVVIKKRLQEIEIDEAGTTSDLAILRPASLGSAENTPLAKKLFFYFAIGQFMCIAFLIFRDAFIPTIRDQHDMTHIGLSHLGFIPKISFNPFQKMPILLRDHPNSVEADAFRALRVRLTSYKDRVELKDKGLTMLITSPRPSTGKTFISTNLAYAFAKSGVKTLLVDFDLRRPSVRERFEKHAYFRNTLEKFGTSGNLLDCTTNIVPNLDVIVPGSPSGTPAEHIEALDIKSFIAQAKQHYDFIIFDTPPALSVIDSFLLTAHVDLDLLVVEYRKTHKEDIANALQLLTELHDVPVLGLVNLIPPRMLSADGMKYYKNMHRPSYYQVPNQSA